MRRMTSLLAQMADALALMSTIRQILDAINQGLGLTTKAILCTFIDRLIVESSTVERCFDPRCQIVALAGDGADGVQITAIRCVIAGNGLVRVDEALAAQ